LQTLFLVILGAKEDANVRASSFTDLEMAPYFHILFTLPAEIAMIALQNREVVYSILFRTAAACFLGILVA
jgi:hypothetical protein